MENPFKYGGVVTGKDFVDREKEINELVRDLRSGKSVVMYSERRMGKTSLLLEVSRRHQDEFIFVYIDLYGMTNRSRFLGAVVSETVSSAYGRAERFAAGIRDLLKETKLRFLITPDGEVGVEFPRREPEPKELAEVLDFPEKVAKRKGKRLVVMFDEFQEVSSFDGVALLKSMRSRFQMHKNVVYVFSGSKRHLLFQIFEEKEGAFFKFARPIELGPILDAEFAKFLVEKFSAAGGRLDRTDAKRIVGVSGGYPYYAQQIAHELFDITSKPSVGKHVERAIENAVHHQSPAFSYLWDTIKSPLQRRYLMAVAQEPGSSRGYEFIDRYGLRSYSHLQRILHQLELRGITEGGRIVDPLFALWLGTLENGQ